MFFSYNHLRFSYHPFPIGLAKPLIDESFYSDLLVHYPALEQFATLDNKVGYKYSLSEKYNAQNYYATVNQPPWRELHQWIKSTAFIEEIMNILKQHFIDLGYDQIPSRSQRWLKWIKNFVRGRQDWRAARLRSRFEFSMLPACGGYVLPHTDLPSKIVTLVVSMVAENEWDTAFGGGTDVNYPKDQRQVFNRLNRQATFDEMDVLHTYEFTPNQAVIFVKTFNSWHSVRPMTAPTGDIMRKTLTINIETY